MVRWRRSTEEVAARVLSMRSNCAGVKVGTTVAAPSGPGSNGLTWPLLLTSMHRSTCTAQSSHESTTDPGPLQLQGERPQAWHARFSLHVATHGQIVDRGGSLLGRVSPPRSWWQADTLHLRPGVTFAQAIGVAVPSIPAEPSWVWNPGGSAGKEGLLRSVARASSYSRNVGPGSLGSHRRSLLTVWHRSTCE